jgi:hypothetical protein
LSDPFEHGGDHQWSPGGQPQGAPASVTDQSGEDAEQLVTQPGRPGAAGVVDAGEGLQQDREVPRQQRDHIHGVHRLVPGEVAQAGAEFGLPDPVLSMPVRRRLSVAM